MTAEQIVKKIDAWLIHQCKDMTISQEERIVYSKVLDQLEQLYAAQ